MTESQLQAACYQWAHNSFPEIRGCLFSVPNGGTRNAREAMLLKATGLTAGIPDLILIWPELAGFEFKSQSGRLSPAQLKIHDIWRSKGIKVYLIKSFEEFKTIIETYARR